jgi:hypothetical protein
VHEASYGSRLGEATDLFDWLPKFRDRMDDVLACRTQDERHPPGRTNRVVMFKSCFPNNNFAEEGVEPGDPAGPQHTLVNAKATFRALLGEFERRPDVLFVCVTTPPLVDGTVTEPLWKRAARKVLKRPGPRPPRPQGAALARRFANWLKAEDGWLADYPGRNVAVFDYYDVLTGDGAGDWSAYGSRNGVDSHPSGAGQEVATRRFLPFLDRAARRAGLFSEPMPVAAAASQERE